MSLRLSASVISLQDSRREPENKNKIKKASVPSTVISLQETRKAQARELSAVTHL